LEHGTIPDKLPVSASQFDDIAKKYRAEPFRFIFCEVESLLNIFLHPLLQFASSAIRIIIILGASGDAGD
jgi:hypothetical protein